MEKERLFYSEDYDDSNDESKNDEITKLIAADNARTQYSQCTSEIRRMITLSNVYSFGYVVLFALFLWLSFAVFPQHRFAFNFGNSTYSPVLVPSLLSVIMSIVVLSLNLVIQFFGFLNERKNIAKLDKLIRLNKRLELKDLMLNSNLYNTPDIRSKAIFHFVMIVAGLVALISYIAIYF